MSRGLGLIIYGIEGIGKTTFALQFPKPANIINLKEPGFLDLQEVGEVPAGVTPLVCDNWEDVMIAIGACQAKTLIIDSISGLQEYLIAQVTNEVYGGNFNAFKSYYNGLRQDCPRYISELLDIVETRRARGTNVIFIAHRKYSVETDTAGPDIQIQTLFGDDGITGPFLKWAQAVLFLAAKKTVTTVTKSAGKSDDARVLEGKSNEKPSRLMYTQFSGAHVAKNKLKLPGVLPMGNSAEESYKYFLEALPVTIKSNLEVK